MGGLKHTCNVCQACGEWGPCWQFYGSILIEEECLPLLKTCSDLCRQKIDDPARWILKLWAKSGAHPSKSVLKTFRTYPDECRPFLGRGSRIYRKVDRFF